MQCNVRIPKQQTQVMLKLQNKIYIVMQLQNNKKEGIVHCRCDVMPELQITNVMRCRNSKITKI
jgi:hypothetical protein